MTTSGVVWVLFRRHLVPLSPSFRSLVAVIWCPIENGAMRPLAKLRACPDYMDAFRRFSGVIWVPSRRHLALFPPSFRALVAVIWRPVRRHFVPLSPSFWSLVAVIWAQGGRGLGSIGFIPPPPIENGAAHLTAKWRSAPSPAVGLSPRVVHFWSNTKFEICFRRDSA